MTARTATTHSPPRTVLQALTGFGGRRGHRAKLTPGTLTEEQGNGYEGEPSRRRHRKPRPAGSEGRARGPGGGSVGAAREPLPRLPTVSSGSLTATGPSRGRSRKERPPAAGPHRPRQAESVPPGAGAGFATGLRRDTGGDSELRGRPPENPAPVLLPLALQLKGLSIFSIQRLSERSISAAPSGKCSLEQSLE